MSLREQRQAYAMGEIRRAAWMARHGLTREGKRTCCPCLLGTKKLICPECRGQSGRPRFHSECQLHNCPRRCGFVRDVVDHARVYVRGGLRSVLTTEPYGISSENRQALLLWAERHGMAVFEHARDDGFHNPGGCVLLVILPVADAPAYAEIQPNAREPEPLRLVPAIANLATSPVLPLQ